MNQIVLNVDNRYTADFLNYLKTLNYVKVQKVKKTKVSDVSKKEQLPLNAALLQAAKPIRTSVTLAQLAQEQGYVKTDWQRLGQLSKELDIQEPIEELFAQLNV
jgi:hypothetical protein